MTASSQHPIAIVGSGVIGSGWAARFLACGYDVVATDPGPDAEKRLRANVDNAWPSLEKLGLAKGASRSRLRFEPDLAKAVAQAAFVQESASEDEAVKRKLIAAIDAAAPADALIASSTSALLPTSLQAECQKAPGRVLVGHPFNPVHLIPLVELVAGEKTIPDAMERAGVLYKAIGMRPLTVRKEVYAFLSNRLQEAIWRECLWLIKDGIATPEELDAAIAYGPGLRWSLMGCFLTFHLGGGDGGMKHFLDHFGPSASLPSSYLKGPEMTPELAQTIIASVDHQAAGRSVKELERRRDAFLVELLGIVRKYWPEAEGIEGRI